VRRQRREQRDEDGELRPAREGHATHLPRAGVKARQEAGREREDLVKTLARRRVGDGAGIEARSSPAA